MNIEGKKVEEKTIGEMVIESSVEEKEKMNKEDIIDSYIEHIRDMSELTDDDITSVIEDTIEEDQELLDILRKFLEKSENIIEKIVSIEVETDEKKIEKNIRDGMNAEKKEEIDDLLGAFDDLDYAYPLEDIIQTLQESEYTDPGTIITDAINDKLLYVDSIDEDNTVYIALTDEGDSLWELRNL